MVRYTSFYIFKKNHFLAQNTKVLAFGFTEKRQSEATTYRNYVFLGREAHILDWLYIIALYRNLYGFFKISNFGSKSKHFSLRFYQKMPVCGKN
jgi:hypothetical protein